VWQVRTLARRDAFDVSMLQRMSRPCSPVGEWAVRDSWVSAADGHSTKPGGLEAVLQQLRGMVKGSLAVLVEIAAST